MDSQIKVVNCAGVRDEQAFWAAYVRGVQVEPSHFGHNLDAFRDALWGGPGWPDADEVRFVQSAALSAPRDGEFVELLEAIGKEVGAVRLTFE